MPPPQPGGYGRVAPEVLTLEPFSIVRPEIATFDVETARSKIREEWPPLIASDPAPGPLMVRG